MLGLLSIENDFVVAVTVVVYAMAIFNIIRIVNHDHNPPTALAWILVNLAIPYLGVPLYYLLGENKLKNYLKRRKRSEAELETLELAGYGTSDLISKAAEEGPTPLSRIFSTFGDVYQPLLCRPTLLVNGEQTFREIFAEIKSAKLYIFVQYYILRSDRLGIELRDLLISKAREGVAVYLLIDDIGSFGLTGSYLRGLKRAGVQIVKFLPLSLPVNLQINFRNHRKLVLVDSRVAFVGGLNVGVEYIGRIKEAFWRDTHLKVEGPLVMALQQVFLDDWYFAAKRAIKLEPMQLLHHEHIKAIKAAARHEDMATAQVIPFGPSDPAHLGVLLFMQLAQSANESIWIASPYFVPDTVMERILELAALRGVDVRILIPRRSDLRLVHWVTLSYARRLAQKGIKVFLYTKGFMHQKVIQVDGKIGVIGTSNFDNRSMYLNFETAVVIHDADFTSKVVAMLIDDFAASHLLVPKPESETLFHNFPGKIARLLAPLL